MAATSKASSISGTLGKRFANQIWAGRSRDPAPLPSFSASASWRASHSSSYDKEVEDQVGPAVVPDHVISPGPGETKYWGPHPQTGVFGPAGEHAAEDPVLRGPSPASGGSSVLEQTVWFRPLEDVEKPPPQN